MATKTSGACLACRARKVKCVPGTPRCARCTAIGIEDCSYGSVKKRGVGSTLRMGQACIPCRRKKTRCDAKQPCTRCVDVDGGVECTYEPRLRFRTTGTSTLSVSHHELPRPASVRNLPFQASPEPPINQALGLSLPIWSDSSESPSSPPLPPPPSHPKRPSTPTVRLPWELSPRIRNELAPHPSSDTSVARKVNDTAKCVPRPAVSTFTILPSIHFQTIHRPLQIPLSLIPPEYMQVSGVAGGDLDMIFRLRSLFRLNKLGLYFAEEKQVALLRGDTSNAVVNQYFVHGLHAIGMHLCGAPEETPNMVQLQARYAQAAWETLVKILRGDDEPKVKVQSLVLLAHAFIIMGFTAGAQFYFLKLCKIIEKAKLQFLPTYGRPAGFSDQFREDASVLSQAIYLENHFYLTLNGPATMLTRIEREFRLDLQRVYPHLFDVCPLTMRTQGILLVRDAISTLNSYSTDQDTDSRRESYQLVLALEKFSTSLVENLQRFINLDDSSGVGTIWACCVACLAHLAALCHFIGQTEPALSCPMDDLFDSTLDKLGSLSFEVHIEEYSQFDVLTGMSWERVLDVINTRIGLCSDAESESLRHWRGVIGKTYADFQTNFPGYEPALLASLAMSADGRTKGSDFPNLMVPKERERYGL